MSTIQPRENCSTMNLKWHSEIVHTTHKNIDVRTPVPNCIALTVSILMIFSPFHGRYKTYFVADVKFWSEWGAAVLTICNFNPLAPPPRRALQPEWRLYLETNTTKFLFDLLICIQPFEIKPWNSWLCSITFLHSVTASSLLQLLAKTLS